MNLAADQAGRLHHYLHEGNFLRQGQTQQLHTFLLVRSAMLRAVGFVCVTFQWVPHGMISVSYMNEVGANNSRCASLHVNPYMLSFNSAGCFCVLEPCVALDLWTSTAHTWKQR
jgi:hypothetical protein